MSSALENSDAPISSDLVRDDPSFAELVEGFVAGMKDRIAKMEEALANSDFENLRISAHQVKGSGGGYGYPILTERAGTLEHCAKDQSLDECKNAFEKLKQVCARIVVNDPASDK